jgi:microcompartment protein CcmK/EutM
MFIARVTGHVVATQKVATLVGRKLLVIEPLRLEEPGRSRLLGTARTLVAVDSLGAGADQIVLVCQGSSARLTPDTGDLPIDAVVIGIVDCVRVGEQDVTGSGAGNT